MIVSERFAKESARAYAFRILQENIIRLELIPGSLVSEQELAKEIGVSRTPVREALLELSKSQIVEIYPQKGSCIALIDYELVGEARFLRMVLEKAIVGLACEAANEQNLQAIKENLKLQEFYLHNFAPDKLLELDNQFHKELFIISNKLQTYQLMNSMTAHFDRVRSMSLKTTKEIRIVEDHQHLLAAIEANDRHKAEILMEQHLSRYKIDEEGLRRQYPEYFKTNGVI